jgi:F-type H+-transporting ATPase subunit epsilon
MQNHMPLISVATIGVIMVRRQAGDPDYSCEYFATNGGAIEIADNQLNVLVDEADHAADINEAEVEAAMVRAKTMKAEAQDKLSLDRAQNLMDHQAARLQVANLRRHHRKP